MFLRSPLEIYYVSTLLLYTCLNAVMLRYLYRNRRIMNYENYESSENASNQYEVSNNRFGRKVLYSTRV